MSMYFRVTINGKRVKISGFSNRREMERIQEKVNALIMGKRIGEISPELSLWVSKLADSDSKLYDRLVELELVERRVKPGTLAELIEIFNLSNADKKNQTIMNRQACCNSLCRFFGADRPVISIKPQDADAFWKYMTENLAAGTYKRRIKTVKQIFNVAIREKWIAENPFAHLKGGNAVNKERQSFVSREIAGKVMDACPNAYWRLIFALGRYGGLRIPSELMHLKWSDILWEQGKIRISIPKKTGKNESLQIRYMPLFRELVTPLQDYFESLPEGCPDLLFPEIREGKNLRRRLEQIILRAGLTPWPKLFVNLRSTRETELMREYPMHNVCAWIGNTSVVALKHYVQITEDDFAQASYLAKTESNSIPFPSSEVPEKGPPRDQNQVRQSISHNSKNAQLISQAPIFSDFPQEKENACDFSQALNLPSKGVGHVPANLVNYGVLFVSEGDRW